MIPSKFNPGLCVLDAIKCNHPAALANVLKTIISHMTGMPNIVPTDRITQACCDFMHDDRRARTEPLRLRLFGKTEIMINAHNGRLRFIDGTADQRFAALWKALTGTRTELPQQEGGADGEAQADADSAD